MNEKYYFQEVRPDTFIEMNDAQIKDAVAQFKQAVMEHPDDFIIEGRDPIIENVYTSSSYIPGVYFPNTSLNFAGDKYYEITCLAMRKNGKYCVVKSFTDDKPSNLTDSQWERYQRVCPQFEYVELDRIIYSDAEIKFRSDMKQSLSRAREYEAALRAIKRVYKKDGSNFVRLDANFVDMEVEVSRSYCDGAVTSVELKGRWYDGQWRKIYVPVTDCGTDISPDQVCGFALEMAYKYHEYAKSYQKQLKASHKAFMKCGNIARKARQEIYSIPEALDDKYFSSLGYALRDYMKQIIE